MSFVVGTAGHIDHGKSTLVTALTGIDRDRLAEEKRRGMTIDLGFAHMTLPSGREIGIVDVPGHARFMRNMLAGAQGLDAVLLVVAADEGVMPQTREHVEILDLLEVRRGLVVLTKVDLVDSDWLELVQAEVIAALEGPSLEGSAVIPVSAPSGHGLRELAEALDGLLEKSRPRPALGRPRLPIDRVFTMSGFGTVVTGTLVDGSIHVGDEMQIVPAGRIVRVRGLQRHNHKVESVGPGSRVAANLSGVEKSDLSRGDVLAHPGTIQPARRIDAMLRVVISASHAVRHGAELLLHTGTAEVGCRVIVLDADEIGPGAKGWVQLYLDRPIAAAVHDRFVLRVPSPAITIAGGSFIDVAPRKHPRHDSAVRESLVRRAAGSVLEEELRKYPRGVTVGALLKATVAPEADVERLHARRLGDWIFSDDAWRSIAARAAHELDTYHGAYPLRAGIAREELRSRLGVPAASFAAVVQGLVEDGRVVERNGSLAAPAHNLAIDTEGGPAAELMALLRKHPLAPPSLPEAMQTSHAGEELVRALAQSGEIVRVSDDVAFTREAYESAVATGEEIVAAGGLLTLGPFGGRLGASPRPGLAFVADLRAPPGARPGGGGPPPPEKQERNPA